jgi:DedD protein
MTAKRSTSSYEVVLENRQLVFIFFGAVMLCAIFFTLGFFVGREQRDLAFQSGPLKLEGEAGPPAAKPGPKKEAAASASATNTTSNQEAINKELTFYKAVEGNSASEGLKVNQVSSTAKVESPKQVSPTPAPAATAPVHNASSVAAGSASTTIIFQVAALSKSVDAEALVRKLKEKGFSAFLVSPPPNSTTDKLYRVQVGPFATVEVAEQVKAKLIANGYTPLVRK